MTVRDLVPSDREALAALVARVANFRPEEKVVANEVLDECLAAPGEHYEGLGAFEGRDLLGFLAFGPVPMTEGVFDLYWIATAPAARRRGAGRALVAAMEARLRARGARKVVIETEEAPAYAGTLAFYERLGYPVAARFPDFYRPGAAKVVMVKEL